MSERFDNYRWIHKALRHQLTDLVQHLSRADWEDAEEGEAALQAVTAALESQADHARHEEAYYHPLLESRVPGATTHFSAEHAQMERAMTAVADMTSRARGGEAVAEDAGLALYLAVARLVGELLVHFAAEETALKPLLVEHFSEAELLELQARIVEDVSPQEMGKLLPHFVSALDPSELQAWLAQLRDGAPAEVFANVCRVARDALAPAIWARVRGALGLADSA